MDKMELQKTWQCFLKNRDVKSKQKLIEHYYLYVQKIASNLAKKLNYKVTAEELASHGLDGLYRAIDYYNSERNVKFETYSYSRIRGAMLDGLRTEDWVPRSVRLRQSQIEKALNKKETKEGHKMSEASVFRKLGIREQEFLRNRKKYKATTVSSLENTFCQDIDLNTNKKDFNRYLVCHNETSPSSKLVRKEFLSKLMGKEFSSLERKTIYYHYYENLTMKEIANKFDISESRMSQIHRSILRRLKAKIERNPTYFNKDIISLITQCNDKGKLF
jgi:RNA polymerase sigma factor for flagellar operon FliA